MPRDKNSSATTIDIVNTEKGKWHSYLAPFKTNTVEAVFFLYEFD
jgi:hypothetical protein